MMNKLTYFKDGIISSVKDIENLSNKDSGKILVFSDTHNGDRDLLLKILDDFGQDVDAFLFCGDGVSEFLDIVQDAITDERLQEKLPELVACVRGNNDSSSYILSFPNEPIDEVKNQNENEYKILQMNIPESVCFTLGNRKIFATHGHRHCVNFSLDQLYTISDNLLVDMVFYGHTHRAYFEDNKGTLILNPGSVCYPRGGQNPMLAVVSFPGIAERYTIEYFTVEKNILGNYSFHPENY